MFYNLSNTFPGQIETHTQLTESIRDYQQNKGLLMWNISKSDTREICIYQILYRWKGKKLWILVSHQINSRYLSRTEKYELRIQRIILIWFRNSLKFSKFAGTIEKNTGRKRAIQTVHWQGPQSDNEPLLGSSWNQEMTFMTSYAFVIKKVAELCVKDQHLHLS